MIGLILGIYTFYRMHHYEYDEDTTLFLAGFSIILMVMNI